jgi:hypothetical protein
VEHGLGLATETGLLAVVAPLACGSGKKQPRLRLSRLAACGTQLCRCWRAAQLLRLPRVWLHSLLRGACARARAILQMCRASPRCGTRPLEVLRPAHPRRQSRSPCAYRLALPVLYWVTFMVMCFLHALQKAFLVFGTFTCGGRRHGGIGALLSAPTRTLGAGGAAMLPSSCTLPSPLPAVPAVRIGFGRRHHKRWAARCSWKRRLLLRAPVPRRLGPLRLQRIKSR